MATTCVRYPWTTRDRDPRNQRRLWTSSDDEEDDEGPIGEAPGPGEGHRKGGGPGERGGEGQGQGEGSMEQGEGDRVLASGNSDQQMMSFDAESLVSKGGDSLGAASPLSGRQGSPGRYASPGRQGSAGRFARSGQQRTSVGQSSSGKEGRSGQQGRSAREGHSGMQRTFRRHGNAGKQQHRGSGSQGSGMSSWASGTVTPFAASEFFLDPPSFYSPCQPAASPLSTTDESSGVSPTRRKNRRRRRLPGSFSTSLSLSSSLISSGDCRGDSTGNSLGPSLSSGGDKRKESTVASTRECKEFSKQGLKVSLPRLPKADSLFASSPSYRVPILATWNWLRPDQPFGPPPAAAILPPCSPSPETDSASAGESSSSSAYKAPLLATWNRLRPGPFRASTSKDALLPSRPPRGVPTRANPPFSPALTSGSITPGVARGLPSLSDRKAAPPLVAPDDPARGTAQEGAPLVYHPDAAGQALHILEPAARHRQGAQAPLGRAQPGGFSGPWCALLPQRPGAKQSPGPNHARCKTMPGAKQSPGMMQGGAIQGPRLEKPHAVLEQAIEARTIAEGWRTAESGGVPLADMPQAAGSDPASRGFLRPSQGSEGTPSAPPETSLSSRSSVLLGADTSSTSSVHDTSSSPSPSSQEASSPPSCHANGPINSDGQRRALQSPGPRSSPEGPTTGHEPAAARDAFGVCPHAAPGTPASPQRGMCLHTAPGAPATPGRDASDGPSSSPEEATTDHVPAAARGASGVCPHAAPGAPTTQGTDVSAGPRFSPEEGRSQDGHAAARDAQGVCPHAAPLAPATPGRDMSRMEFALACPVLAASTTRPLGSTKRLGGERGVDRGEGEGTDCGKDGQGAGDRAAATGAEGSTIATAEGVKGCYNAASEGTEGGLRAAVGGAGEGSSAAAEGAEEMPGLSPGALVETVVEAHEALLVDESPNGTHVAEFLLSGLLQLTGSEMGFIASLCFDADGSEFLKTHAITNIGWTPELRQWYADNRDTGLIFQNMATLFGHVIKASEVVISNEPAGDPRSSGVPAGHPAVSTFLGVPLLAGGELVGMYAVANRREGYSQELLGDLWPLTRTVAHIVTELRKRARDLDDGVSEGGQSSVWFAAGTPGREKGDGLYGEDQEDVEYRDFVAE